MALIAQAYLYQFSIANSKVLSIYISIGYSWTSSGTIYSFEFYGISVGFDFDNSKAFDDGCFNSFEDGVAELRDKYERVCMGASLYDSTPL